MRYNTLSTRMYNMRAAVRTWERKTNPVNQLDYRNYEGETQWVDCTVTVTQVGSILLYAAAWIKPFSLVIGVRDRYDRRVLAMTEESTYWVTKVSPVMDASGSIQAARHQLSTVTPEQLIQPINPPVEYAGVDQQGF